MSSARRAALAQSIRASFNRSSPEFAGRVREITEAMQQMFDYPTDREALAAAAHIVYESLKTQTTANGLHIDGLGPEEEEEEIAGDERSMADFIDDTNPTEAPNIRDLFNFGSSGSGPADATVADSLANVAWFQALENAGIPNGRGDTPDDPVVMLAPMHLRKLVKIQPPKLDISVTVPKERVQEVQATLVRMLNKHVWRGLSSLRPRYMRLHPWTLTRWINMFTTQTFGSRGLSQVNNILSTARDESMPAAPQSIMQIRSLQSDTTLTRQERNFYGTMEAATQGQMKSSAWAVFLATYDSCRLVDSFDALCRDVGENPIGEVARSMRRHGTKKAHDSGNVRDGVLNIIAEDLKWSVQGVRNLLGTSQPLGLIAKEIGMGFLLLQTRTDIGMIRATSLSTLQEILPIVLEHFPEIKEISHHVEATIIPKLLSEDPNEFNKLTKQKVSFSTRGPKFVELIDQFVVRSGNNAPLPC